MSRKYFATSCLLAFVLAVAISCTEVTRSTHTQLLPIDQRTGPKIACRSSLGSYQLSKTILKLTVSRNYVSDNNGVAGYFQDITPIATADRDHTYCLDFMESITAEDDVQVRRTATITKSDNTLKDGKNTPFLQLVTSKAVDQTALIIRKAIRAIFIGLSGNPNFPGTRTATEIAEASETKTFDIDPFDPASLVVANNGLRRFGFCVSMGRYTYDTEAINASRFCGDPLGTINNYKSTRLAIVNEQKRVRRQPANAIFYRPRQNYTIYIYAKADPEGPGPWRLIHSRDLALENISPVLAVGVKRSLFTKHHTALIFDDSVLESVCISKGSEIAGFIDIPIDIIYGLVQLPTQVIQTQINSLDQQSGLVAAQNKLIEQQNAHMEFLESEQDKTPGTTRVTGANSNTGTPLPSVADNAPEPLTDASFKPRVPSSVGVSEKSPELNDICKKVRGNI